MSGLMEYQVTVTIHRELVQDFTDPGKLIAFLQEIFDAGGWSDGTGWSYELE